MKHFPLQSQPLNTDISSRTRTPTILVEGRSNITARTAAKRRLETMKAASRIHGGSENNPSPALDGMFDTLVQYRLNPYVHWPRVSPREERTKHKTKPRRSLGKRVLQWPRLRALNCLCLLFVCVSLLVIRVHLPKRFSRKPLPPLVISLMHRSWLDLLSLEIIRRTFEVKLRLI